MISTNNNHKGFSLIELMVVMAIASIVMAGIYMFYQSNLRSYMTQQTLVDMQQDMRAAMYMMTREIRVAGYDPSRSTAATFLIASTAEVQFQLDDNGDGDFDDGGGGNDPNEQVRYVLSNDADGDGVADGTPCNLERQEWADPVQIALKTDLEAAAEAARQLRLRDLGGVIVIDFIDLDEAKHRRQVERALAKALKGDRARMKTLPMNSFGLLELTRQRVRPSLMQTRLQQCQRCGGRGYVKSAELVAMAALTELEHHLEDKRVGRVELTVAPEVCQYILNQRRRFLVRLEEDSGKKVVIRQDRSMPVDTHQAVRYDQSGRRLRSRRR